MKIKRLQQEEILEALHLVWEVFAEDIAPSYTLQGVEAFQKFIKLENFMPRVISGEITVFGAVQEGEQASLSGMIAVQSDGHIPLFFVRKNYQRQGIGKMLMNTAYQYVVGEKGVMRLTVNASPNAWEAYAHMGFSVVIPEQEKDGIRYIPMEKMAAPGDIRPNQIKTSHKGLIVGLAVLIILLFVGTVFFTGVVVKNIIDQAGTYRSDINTGIGAAPFEEYGDGSNEPGYNLGEWFEDGSQEEEAEDNGLESVECYVDPDIKYTIREENYRYQSDGTDGEYPMEFDITYPQIEGLNSGVVDEINAQLKECAMSTVNTLYLNPSEDMKETMLQQSDPFMASKVIYRVTYAGEDFISVAFSDEYYAGNIYAGYADLRTRNFRLSDGKLYETEDIFTLSDEFIVEWLAKMKEEAPGSEVLEALNMAQFRKILGGEVLDNRYYDNFFINADGIDIGMTYHYRSSDENTVIARGWITTNFDMEEIAPYRSNSDFWKLVQSND